MQMNIINICFSLNLTIFRDLSPSAIGSITFARFVHLFVLLIQKQSLLHNLRIVGYLHLIL